MAATGSLDDVLNSKVDENDFSALVGTLEDQIYSGPDTTLPSSTSNPPTSRVSEANAGQQVSVPNPSSSTLNYNCNGARDGDALGYDGNKSVSSNIQKGVVLTGAGLRTVSAHSQAGVIQTGHFPQISRAHAGTVGTVTVSKADGIKQTQTSAPQASVPISPATISSVLANGTSGNGGHVNAIQNGRQVLATASGNRIINVPPANTPTVIVNKQGGMAGTATPVGAAAATLTSGVQVINVQQARPQSPNIQKALAPRLVLSQQSSNRAATPGQPLTLQTLQAGLQTSGSGHILVRTENGQLKLLQLPPQAGAVAAATTASSSVSAPATAGVTPKGPAVAAAPAPAPRPAPASGGSQPAQQPQGAMAPDTAKVKCKNFLATLLRLAKDQPESVAWNVRALIQSLIDGKLEPESFTTRLQKELNSSPQPCLVPFLKKSLPFLRQSLYSREITIEGVKPPPPSALPAPLGTVPTMHSQPRPAVVSVAVTPAASPAAVRRPTTVVTAPPRAVSGHPAMQNVQPLGAKTARVATPTGPAASAAAPSTVLRTGTAVSASRPAAVAVKKDRRIIFRPTAAADAGADDDFNDVAAMGGVNLLEESRKSLGVGGGEQLRSVRDDTFLPSAALQLKIRQIAMRHGLEEPGPDVVALVSHATQERLKSLLERLSVIAEHRMEVIKSEPRYEVSRDIRAQLRFLEDLDKLERKRHEETEREMLLRAAKSRSKAEDPEQAKLKAKAKEMQRVEMEEVRQREANLTALSAIGPRKKPRLEGDPAADGPTVTGLLSNKQIAVRPRVKRVNARDLQLLLEKEPSHQRSARLYRLLSK